MLAEKEIGSEFNILNETRTKSTEAGLCFGETKMDELEREISQEQRKLVMCLGFF